MTRRGIVWTVLGGGAIVAIVLVATVRAANAKPDSDLQLLLRYGHSAGRFEVGEKMRYHIEFGPKTPMLDRALRSELLSQGWSPYRPLTTSWVLTRPHWTGSYATSLHAVDGRNMILSQYSTGEGYAILTVDAAWPHRLLVRFKSAFGLK